MQRLFPRPLVVLAVFALLAPTASATWFVYGSHEPDNGLDTESLMRFEPPGTQTDLIYFNVVTGMSTGLRGIMTSPNVGLVESHNEIPTEETHQAIFGVWVDCNGDGYIGIAESAMREYPSNLLLNTTVCPSVTGPTFRWTAGAHNYNGWVSELVPIAGIPNGISDNTTDLRRYDDPEAMAWGDFNRPDDGAAGGGTCPIYPQPRGTFQSTGGALNYADCLSGAYERWNDVWFGRELAGQSIPGLTDFGIPTSGLTFEDENNATGTIFDQDTAGTEDSDHAAVYVVDCSSDAEPAFHSGDFFNGTPLGPTVPADLQNTSIIALDPRVGDLGAPTVPAQVNQTNEEVFDDCNTANDAGADFYGSRVVFIGEDDVAPITGANKRESNFNFQFQFWDRGATVIGFGPNLPFVGGPAGFSLPGKPMSNWNNGGAVLKTPNTVRADLNAGTAEIDGAYYLTFYAHVGSATTARSFKTPGGDGVYGSAQCGDSDSGIQNGWNCDADLWYRNANGSPFEEPTPLARPGQVYEFRDVDCYDGGIGQTGLSTGLPYYGTQACLPAPTS